ncbi:MAG TPA: hypothetical protein VK356_05035 [Thermomicrobiales bacterium]|nr:hypothetical protein [Thermomicrobiales bacterium]
MVLIVWPLKIATAILNSGRREKIPTAHALLLISSIDRLRVVIGRGIAPEFLTQETLTNGMTHSVPAFDAGYLELAMWRGLPLSTQDE